MIYLLRHRKDGNSLIEGVRELDLLDVEYIPPSSSSLSSNFDYILLTSVFSVSSLRMSADMDFFVKLPAICVGEATASSWQRIGGIVFYRQSSKPNLALKGSEDLVHSVRDFVLGKRILYARGMEVATNMRLSLGLCGADVVEVVVYMVKERPIDKNKIIFEKGSVFIFGAPSHYRAFLNIYGWRDDFYAIAIGRITYSSFKKGINSFISSGGYRGAVDLAKGIERKCRV